MNNNLKDKFDYYICGSDQIWNPYFEGNTGVNFLNFSDYNKNIAYAPSFGCNTFPQEKAKKFSMFFDNIKYISCREKNGVDFIKSIGHECKLVLDPTLLLNENEWSKIIKKPNIIVNKKILLVYFLGKISDDYYEYIQKLSIKNNLEIINISEYRNIGPCEFLYLIKKSKIICTDSYHGTIFSIIFNKPYINFDRNSDMNNMNSRFESLSKILNLSNRNYKNLAHENCFNMNYEKVNQKLEELKTKSVNYLKESINYWE